MWVPCLTKISVMNVWLTLQTMIDAEPVSSHQRYINHPSTRMMESLADDIDRE